jgi:hypothetical protein
MCSAAPSKELAALVGVHTLCARALPKACRHWLFGLVFHFHPADINICEHIDNVDWQGEQFAAKTNMTKNIFPYKRNTVPHPFS